MSDDKNKQRVDRIAAAFMAQSPSQTRRWPLASLKVIAVLAMLSLGFMGYKECTSGYLRNPFRTAPDQMPPVRTGNSSLALSMAQEFVKDRLIAPGSAEWPGIFEGSDHVTALGNKRYRIESWVDSQNAFGALLRIQYTAIVVDAGGDRWKLESLDLDE